MKYAPYSASRLATYEQCPRKFKYKYVDKIKLPFEEHSLALTRGKIIHHLLEYHNKLTLKESIDKLKFDDDINTSPYFTKEVIKECIQVYRKFVETDIAKSIFGDFELGTELKVALNKKLEPCEYLDKDTLFRGLIDRVVVDKTTDLVRIIDWKTGKDKSGSSGIKQTPDQLMHYGSWYFAKFPVDKIKIVYVFVEHNTTLEYTLTRERVQDYKKALLLPIIKAEKDEVFEKITSPLCDYCEFRDVCNGDVDGGTIEF